MECMYISAKISWEVLNVPLGSPRSLIMKVKEPAMNAQTNAVL